MDLQFQPHKAVKHPQELLIRKPSLNDRFLDYIAEHVLPSAFLADIALIVPLLAIKAPDSVKLTLGVISGSWIQWWALHILQRSNIRADHIAKAKAKADLIAITHIANVVDFVADHIADQCEDCQVHEELPPISNPNYTLTTVSKPDSTTVIEC